MGSQEVSPRIVFDTNIVVSALLFRGRLDWMRKAWYERTVIPLANKVTVQELYQVLSYPKFSLSAADCEELLGDYLPFAELVNMSSRLPVLPKCRDVDDQKFIELADAAKADMMVTGDKDLLVMAEHVNFMICGPAALQETLEVTRRA